MAAKKDNTVLYIGAGILLLLLLNRKGSVSLLTSSNNDKIAIPDDIATSDLNSNQIAAGEYNGNIVIEDVSQYLCNDGGQLDENGHRLCENYDYIINYGIKQ